MVSIACRSDIVHHEFDHIIHMFDIVYHMSDIVHCDERRALHVHDTNGTELTPSTSPSAHNQRRLRCPGAVLRQGSSDHGLCGARER